jgi:hypothetical protein
VEPALDRKVFEEVAPCGERNICGHPVGSGSPLGQRTPGAGSDRFG